MEHTCLGSSSGVSTGTSHHFNATSTGVTPGAQESSMQSIPLTLTQSHLRMFDFSVAGKVRVCCILWAVLWSCITQRWLRKGVNEQVVSALLFRCVALDGLVSPSPCLNAGVLMHLFRFALKYAINLSWSVEPHYPMDFRRIYPSFILTRWILLF